MNTVIGIDKTGSYRVYAACCGDEIAKAESIHQSSNPAFGMAITAAGIMGLMLTADGDKLSLIFKGDAEEGVRPDEIVATANAKGTVKAYISSDSIKLKGGSLTVIKDLGLKEPYIGKTELESGDISQDLAKYFALSEQQPSAVALAPNGGFIVQVLPDADDEVLTKLEDTLFMLDSVALLIEDAEGDPAKLTELIFKDDVRILEERDIKWQCDCSRDRMKDALISLGKKELSQIIEEDGQAELTCQFCRTTYLFDKEELTELMKNA